VTPDSFSDGGRFLDPQRAIEHARRLAVDGADILDIGAESTRPYGGAVPVSIDTMKASVASVALEAGASIVNDVWGLQRDPDMARVVAEHTVPVIIMHNRDSVDPAIDIVADVTAFFARSLEIAAKANIARDMIVLDPGVVFGKTPEQSMQVIAKLNTWKSF